MVYKFRIDGHAQPSINDLEISAANVGLGITLVSKRPKDVSGAETAFRTAIMARPAMVKAHLALGTLLEEERGDLEGALQVYRAALASCVPHSSVAQQRVDALLPRVAALCSNRRIQQSKAKVRREMAKAAGLFVLVNLANMGYMCVGCNQSFM